MTEPTSSAASAAVALSAVTVTSILPGVNGDALIGAFAGAAVFALHTTNIPVLKRIVYMIVSVLLGYFGSDEVMRLTGLESHTLAAFGLSAVAVTVTLISIDRLYDIDITKFFRRGG